MAGMQMMGGFQIPPVVKNLLIINVLVWIAELTFKDPFVFALSMHYSEHPEFGIWQIFTYMFLHSPQPDMFFHLLFNMLGVLFIGSTLERVWGSKRFLMFYLICGICAGLVQLLAGRIEMLMLENSLTKGSISESEYIAKGRILYNGIVLGASGAVMGIFAAFAYLFPNTPMMIIPIPVPIKAKYLMIGLILLDLFGGINPRYSSGIAHFAHIGGAVIGLILVMIMNRNNRKTFY